MSRRHPTQAEIDLLAALGRRLSATTSRAARDQVEDLVAMVTVGLSEDGVPFRRQVPHLDISEAQLRRIRHRRPPVALPSDRAPMFRIELDPDAAVAPREHAMANELPGEAVAYDATVHAVGPSWSGSAPRSAPAQVIVALGHPATDEGWLQLQREGKAVKKPLVGRPSHVEHLATPADLLDFAMQRPFALQIGGHREMGATFLADVEDGGRIAIADEDLIGLLVPEGGGPALLVLTFCGSRTVADLLREPTVAVISFEGDTDDDGIVTFVSYLYRSLANGHPIRLSFEVASSAVRLSGDLSPHLSGDERAKDRRMP